MLNITNNQENANQDHNKISPHTLRIHLDDPEGWDGEGGGRGIRIENTCKSMADSCQCMAKTTTIF